MAEPEDRVCMVEELVPVPHLRALQGNPDLALPCSLARAKIPPGGDLVSQPLLLQLRMNWNYSKLWVPSAFCLVPLHTPVPRCQPLDALHCGAIKASVGLRASMPTATQVLVAGSQLSWGTSRTFSSLSHLLPLLSFTACCQGTRRSTSPKAHHPCSGRLRWRTLGGGLSYRLHGEAPSKSYGRAATTAPRRWLQSQAPRAVFSDYLWTLKSTFCGSPKPHKSWRTKIYIYIKNK